MSIIGTIGTSILTGVVGKVIGKGIDTATGGAAKPDSKARAGGIGGLFLAALYDIFGGIGYDTAVTLGKAFTTGFVDQAIPLAANLGAAAFILLFGWLSGYVSTWVAAKNSEA